MSAVKQWYALCTAIGCEKKVADSLTKKGLDNYHPVKCVAGKHNRKDRLTEPLFHSMVFARMAKADQEAAKEIPGVLSRMYWLKEPAVFMDTEIEMLHRFLHEHPYIQLQKVAVRKDEMVRISGSGFDGAEGVAVNRIPVQLHLPSMGYILSAVETNKVEVLVRGADQQVKISKNLAIVR